MIEIMNLRKANMTELWDVSVARPSPLGNRFYMSNEDQRDRVCDEYDKWLIKKIAEKDKIVCDELNRLAALYKNYGKLRLFCWCAPKRCHVETIKRQIEILVNSKLIH